MPFAPESIHERIDIFDDRIAIELRTQLSNQFLKCLLKKRMVIAGLITRMWILQKSLSFSRALLIANHQINFRNFFQHKIRQRRFMLVIRRAHLNAQSDPLVVLLRQFKNQLHVIGHLQPPRPRLHLPPGRTDIKLLAQRKTNQVFNRLRNIVGLDLLRAAVRRDIGDQPFAVIRHNLFGRRSRHHHIVRRNHGVRRILRKWPLIQPIGNRGPAAKVVVPPVVRRNLRLRFTHPQFRRYRNRDTAF